MDPSFMMRCWGDGMVLLAEKYHRWSLYNYAVDNPMRFIDPDGMVVDDIHNYAGKKLGSTSSGNNIRIMQVCQDEYNNRSEAYVLQNSRVVTVESPELVDSKLNEMSTNTNKSDGVEAKAYIVLNTENATLTLDVQPQTSDDTKHTGSNRFEGPLDFCGSSYKKPSGGSDNDVIVGEAHAHNADKNGVNADGSSGYTSNSTEVEEGSSERDATTAQRLGAPVNAIDGNDGHISTVLPSGEPNNTVDRNNLLRRNLELNGGKR